LFKARLLSSVLRDSADIRKAVEPVIAEQIWDGILGCKERTVDAGLVQRNEGSQVSKERIRVAVLTECRAVEKELDEASVKTAEKSQTSEIRIDVLRTEADPL
jgi:hypothetical protein